MRIKDLRDGDRIVVTNTKSNTTAVFSVQSRKMLGVIPVRVLQESSLGAIYADDIWPLSGLKDKDVVWHMEESTP